MRPLHLLRYCLRGHNRPLALLACVWVAALRQDATAGQDAAGAAAHVGGPVSPAAAVRQQDAAAAQVATDAGEQDATAAQHATDSGEQDAAAAQDAHEPSDQDPEAAQPAIEVIGSGWDGTAVPGTWTPLRLRVTGGAKDARALVEVVLEARYRPAPQAPRIRYPIGAYGHEIALPAATRRELTVWFPADGVTRARARLSADGEALAETTIDLQMARQGWPLIAVLADAPIVAQMLSAIELPYQGLPIPLAVAELTPDAIPAMSARFEAIGALVVQGSVTAQLTQTQRNAVLDWVRGGGHLVLAGGPSVARAMRVLPDGTLRIDYGQIDASTPLGVLADWLGSEGDVASITPAVELEPDAGSATPAQTSANEPGTTLQFEGDAGGGALLGRAEVAPLWRIPFGRGAVTALAFDPGVEPVASSAGGTELLRAALAPALGAANDGRRAYIPAFAMRPSMRMQEVVLRLPPGAHPGWRVAAVVLVLFALTVGPVLYLVLRRHDRRELSWVVVPLAAIGLAVGIYAVGATGSDVIANVASYIDIGEDGVGRESVAAAYYAPTHGELTVPLPPNVLVRAFVAQSEPFLRPAIQLSGSHTMVGEVELPDWPTEPPFHVVEGPDRRIRFTTGQYSPRTVLIESRLAAPPRVHAELTVERGLLVGTVQNQTGLTLEHASIIVGTNVAHLGTLAPGQSAPVRLEPTTDANPRSRYQPLSHLLFGRPISELMGAQTRSRAGFPEPRAVPDDPEIQRRAHFVDAVFARYSPGFDRHAVPLSFLAFTRASKDNTARNQRPSEASADEQSTGQDSVVQGRIDPGSVEERPSAELSPDENPAGDSRVGAPLIDGSPTRGRPPGEEPIGGFLDPKILSAGGVVHHLTLVRQTLNLALAPGPFTIPAGLVPAEAVEESAPYGRGGGMTAHQVSYVELASGFITYAFRPPLPGGARADTLVLTTEQVGRVSAADSNAAAGSALPTARPGSPRAIPPRPDERVGPAAPGVFSVYDWQAEQWLPLPEGSQHRIVAAGYLGPDGEVRVRVSDPQKQTLRFVVPSLAIEGHVQAEGHP